MGVEPPRHATLMGLEVTNAAGYARYRAGMTPILETFGGRFEHDFVVAEVLHSSAGKRINRVFVLSFPDADARARFFADPAYRRVRAEHFEPSVAQSSVLATFAMGVPAG